MEEILDDGFGNQWENKCGDCGYNTLSIVRPGKVQCAYCDLDDWCKELAEENKKARIAGLRRALELAPTERMSEMDMVSVEEYELMRKVLTPAQTMNNLNQQRNGFNQALIAWKSKLESEIKENGK